ncbi:MAG: hypothetical protein M1831_004509 [Alyxoria varia]|nr:MAG: hypothetical protein M1831_004509 [Alyxoria varia]
MILFEFKSHDGMGLSTDRVVAIIFYQTRPDDSVAENFLHILKSLRGDINVSSHYQRKLDDKIREVSFQSSIPCEELRQRKIVSKLETQLDAQIIFRHALSSDVPVRLAVFDMDSTLIQQEVIDLLAAHAGVEESVAAVTARAMNGELDFSASLRERVAVLKGIPETVFEDLKPRLTLTPGADVLLRCLKRAGAKTALLSGGFMPLATHIAKVLDIDYVYANELTVENGSLTGELAPSCVIVNAERKRELLQSIAAKEQIRDPGQIMSVGDGANDLLMLEAAGLGIAVNAKPRVQDLAPCKLNCESLVDVLHVLGLTREAMESTKLHNV